MRDVRGLARAAFDGVGSILGAPHDDERAGRGSLGELLTATGDALCDVEIDYSTGEVIFSGHDARGMNAEVVTTRTLSAGSWNLVECLLDGLGTDAGVRTLYWNGQRAARMDGLDFVGRSISSFGLGQPWADTPTFLGVLDFDDARVAARPQATLVRLDGGARLAEGVCAPISLELADAEGALRALPFPATVTFLVNNLEVFPDQACSVPMIEVELAANRPAMVVFVRGRAGRGDLTSRVADLLPGAHAITFEDAGFAGADSGTSDGGGTVERDAGVEAPVRALRVGCETAPGALFVLLLFLLRLRR